MPRLKDSTRLERRRRIASAALDCFAENGIAGTTMADIIRASGLSSGAIYSHFDSKADLLRYVMSTMLEERFTAIGDAPEEAPAPTPEALVARLLDGAAADRSRTTVLVQVWGEISRDGDLAAVAEENLAHLRTLLIGGLRPWAEQRDGAELGLATATRTADLAIAVSFGYATLLALRPSVDPEELRDHLLGALRLPSGSQADRTETDAL